MSLNIEDLTVLLIEPSSTQSKILKQAMEAEGVTKLDILTSGNEALEYLNSCHPDLVISAMYYPDMTAIQLLQTIRSNSETEDLNFMLISSETSFEMINPIKQAGVLAVLPKPFDRRDFKTALMAARDTLQVSSLELDVLDLDTLKGLIVDDSMTARKHISKLLASCGIESFLEAENGKQAIEILGSENVDFIITDYNMPEMNGQELAEYLQQSEYSYLPVLMVTSEANDSRLSAIRQSGVCALFDKTIDPSSLKSTLSNALNQ